MAEYPKEWKRVPMEKVIRDAAYGVGAPAVPYDHKVKYIRITDIDDESHLYEPSPMVSPAFYENKHLVGENDILIARTGASVGKSYLSDAKDGPMVYAGFLMKINVVGADAKFIFFHTLTKRYMDWVAAESMRTGQPGLNLEQLKRFEISLPPLPEQRRIAVALGDMDKLIENLGKRIAKKRLIKKGAMQELLTGKKRLPGFSGEWKERKIGDMLTIGHGRDYKGLANGDVPVFGTGGYMCSVDGWLHDGPTVCIGRKGTIDRPMYLEGKIWTVDTLFYTHSFVDANPKFVYYKFLMIDWLGYNAASGVPSLTSKTIEGIWLNMPCLIAEQAAIARVLSDMDAEIASLERRQAKLKSIKKGMLQDLLTGKVRI